MRLFEKEMSWQREETGGGRERNLRFEGTEGRILDDRMEKGKEGSGGEKILRRLGNFFPFGLRTRMEDEII